MILVTGSTGQVGKELQTLASNYSQFDFIFTSRKILDFSDDNFHAQLEKLDVSKIKYCINCAAYTAVDKAEQEQGLAFKVNSVNVEQLALFCKHNNIKLIHISTDYVYHSTHNQPYIETNETNPKGIYAKSKLEGELASLKNLENVMIIRTSWVYSSYGHNFVKSMIRLGTEREQLRIVYDQIGSPTYAKDLASFLLDTISKIETGEIEEKKSSGIFHYSNEGVCSWYDFAKAIFELTKIECIVHPILSEDYPTPAKRPHFSLLDKEKIKQTFNITIPYWKDSLKSCLELMGY